MKKLTESVKTKSLPILYIKSVIFAMKIIKNIMEHILFVI